MLKNTQTQIYFPDNNTQMALTRTTDLCIAAHQDDIEIMAAAPIISCFGKTDRWFTGVVVTDGAGSPRSGIYADYTDEQMKEIRATEQKTAAMVGGYSAQYLLSYPSSAVKDSKNTALVEELVEILKNTMPEVVYTHNLADKHDTHVAVVLRVIAALRCLPVEMRPKKVYAMEVWRGLDWLCDADKTVFDTGEHLNLQAALLRVFDSQIAGGKRYDEAALGRRVANATFYASHNTDNYQAASYAIDITELMTDPSCCPAQFIVEYLDRFKNEILHRIEAFVK